MSGTRGMVQAGVVLSHAEIADRLGISRSRVQQIEATALRKLRELLKRAGVRRAYDHTVEP